MKTSLQNFNGLFQVDYHKRFTRLLWVLSIPILISIIVFWVWTTESQVDGDVLVILFMFALPVFGIIIAIGKAIKKPGIYLRGIRISNTGIEIGTLTLDINSAKARNIWKDQNADRLLEGDWKEKSTIRNKAVNFLIGLRAGGDPTSSIFFERFALISGDKSLHQMIGNNSPENFCKDFVAVSNGSFKLLAKYNGIAPDQLFLFLDRVADIISTCRVSPPPTCTLRIAPSSAKGGSVLAYGVLGGFNTTGADFPRDNEHLGTIFNKSFTKSLRKFIKDRGWVVAE